MSRRVRTRRPGSAGRRRGHAWAVAFVGFGPGEAIARTALARSGRCSCATSRGKGTRSPSPGDVEPRGGAHDRGGPDRDDRRGGGGGARPRRGGGGPNRRDRRRPRLLAIGALAPWIEEPLRPARGAWLDAVSAAHEALLRTDPDEAVREALVALHAPAGLSAPSPELWTFDPILVTTVDAAGYPHGGEGGVIPEGMVATAGSEPEAILRAEVLEALSVRRPELRPFARWMGRSRCDAGCGRGAGGRRRGSSSCRGGNARRPYHSKRRARSSAWPTPWRRSVTPGRRSRGASRGNGSRPNGRRPKGPRAAGWSWISRAGRGTTRWRRSGSGARRRPGSTPRRPGSRSTRSKRPSWRSGPSSSTHRPGSTRSRSSRGRIW